MKKRTLLKNLAITTLCLSFSTALMAQNLDNEGIGQSYFVTEEGRPYTVKSEVPAEGSGWSTIYSPDGFFYQKELVDTFGSKYVIMKNSMQVHTIDSRGDFYKKIDQFVEGKIEQRGANYFTTSEDVMYIVKADGKLVKRKRGDNETKLKKFELVAGMFFISKKNKSIGIVNPFTGDIDYKSYYSLGQITEIGDNFVISANNKITTIGFENIGGTYQSSIQTMEMPELVSSVKAVGGNFFIDQDNKVYTINDQGVVSEDGLIIGGHGNEIPTSIGGNYMIFSNGELHLVDERGDINFVQRLAVRISDIKL